MTTPTDKNTQPKSRLKRLVRFYFRPQLRSVATIFYLIVFGYCAIYYADGVSLAIKFLFYIGGDSSALTGIHLLFTGLAFVISLVLPFATCFYAILVLPVIWRETDWSLEMKWIMSFIVAIGAFFIIMVTDTSARLAANQPAMQSFIEDVGLNGKI